MLSKISINFQRAAVSGVSDCVFFYYQLIGEIRNAFFLRISPINW